MIFIWNGHPGWKSSVAVKRSFPSSDSHKPALEPVQILPTTIVYTCCSTGHAPTTISLWGEGGVRISQCIRWKGYLLLEYSFTGTGIRALGALGSRSTSYLWRCIETGSCDAISGSICTGNDPHDPHDLTSMNLGEAQLQLQFQSQSLSISRCTPFLAYAIGCNEVWRRWTFWIISTYVCTFLFFRRFGLCISIIRY